ncbi:uncharacterized protein [Lolium perenne]|uniref:uncharacterized protein n=1 Tax=Lolium perenne TaxID=4522 RepID=UPI003A9A1457
MHGTGGRLVSDSVRWVLETTYDLAQLGKKKKPAVGRPKPCWTRPDYGTMKINVDACFNPDTLQGASGLVVRDHNGLLIRGQAIFYEHATSALVMEAQAIRDGVQLALERNYQKVEIQTDAQEVLKMMDDPGGGKSIIASICQEVKELGGSFSSLKFSFVGRLANEAAHNCAKQASSVRRRCLWINFTPPFLVDILAKDCNPII